MEAIRSVIERVMERISREISDAPAATGACAMARKEKEKTGRKQGEKDARAVSLWQLPGAGEVVREETSCAVDGSAPESRPEPGTAMRISPPPTCLGATAPGMAVMRGKPPQAGISVGRSPSDTAAPFSAWSGSDARSRGEWSGRLRLSPKADCRWCEPPTTGRTDVDGVAAILMSAPCLGQLAALTHAVDGRADGPDAAPDNRRDEPERVPPPATMVRIRCRSSSVSGRRSGANDTGRRAALMPGCIQPPEPTPAAQTPAAAAGRSTRRSTAHHQADDTTRAR